AALPIIRKNGDAVKGTRTEFSARSRAFLLAFSRPLACLLFLCLALPAFAQESQIDPLPKDAPQPPPKLVEAKRDTPAVKIVPGKVIRSDVDLALVNITVTDPFNRLVTGLDQDNFRVFEDNTEQEIVTFSSEDVPISI